jgi:hypothetical protein
VSLGDGQPPRGAPGIMQRGDDGQRGCGIEGYRPQHGQWDGSIYLTKKDREQGQDLRAGTCLAVDAGTEVAHAETDIEKRGNDEDTEVTAKNQDGDPTGHELLMHEHEEQCAEEKLVGHRIEVLTDLGLLLEQPCGQTIEAVTESGDDKEAKRGLVVGLKHRDHEKRYKAKAQESQQVRGCAKFFQQGFPVFLGKTQKIDGT